MPSASPVSAGGGPGSSSVERIARWSRAVSRSGDPDELAGIVTAVAAQVSGFDEVWAWRIEPGRYATVAAVAGVDASMVGSVAEPTDIAPATIFAAGRAVPIFVYDVAELPVTITPPALHDVDVALNPAYDQFANYWRRLARYGARGAFSLPIAAGRQEWCILAGFSTRPVELPRDVVAELELLSQRASSRLAELVERDRLVRATTLAALSSAVLRYASAAPSIRQGLLEDPVALAAICSADSVALRFIGPDEIFGERQPEDLASAVLDEASRTLYAQPRALEEPASGTLETSSGPVSYLAISLGDRPHDVLAWVRRPRRRQVRRVAQRFDTHVGDGSFGELVHDAIELLDDQWTQAELDVAVSLRDGLRGLQSGRYHHLAQRVAELQQANEEFDAFTHSAAHDLRAPIRGIRQNIEFYLEDTAGQIDDTITSQLHTAIRLTDRMRELLDDLMRYAEIGHAAKAPRPIDLRAAVDEVLELLGPATTAEARITVGRGVIHADPSGLRQLLQNLIGNAIAYSTQAPRIEISIITLSEARARSAAPVSVLDRDPATPVLAVSDQGAGIPESRLQDIFQLFTRASSIPHGTGTGLALCRRIARRHGGDIWAISPPDGGATFFTVLQPA